MNGQVDQKFIACLLEPASGIGGETLVLIDQHAADERVSVEAILQELCDGFINHNVEIKHLSEVEPRVILSKVEAELLARSDILSIFSRWGIHLDVPRSSSDYVQVTVTAVPTCLKARLGREEAKEITRLIKLYLPVLDNSLGELEAMLVTGGIEKFDWVRVLRWMPKEMLELCNSKACRGEPICRSSGQVVMLNRCNHVWRYVGYGSMYSTSGEIEHVDIPVHVCAWPTELGAASWTR